MAGAEGIVKIPEFENGLFSSWSCWQCTASAFTSRLRAWIARRLKQVFANMKGTIFGWFNMFSGGALERFSIFALGVMPYISSSIIFQLLTVVWPYLHDSKRRRAGTKENHSIHSLRNRFPLSDSGYGIATGLEHYSNPLSCLILASLSVSSRRLL